MLEFIKEKYQQKILCKLLKGGREKRIENWECIKSIGLIFVVGNEGYWDLINRFIKAQQKQGKKIHLIGLHPKDYHIDYIFTHTDTIICNAKDDFTFFGTPKTGLVEQFTDYHLDLLIDATEQPCYFGKYITARTNADLKVGYTNSEADNEGSMDMYDLTIKGNNTIDFKDYIEQVVKYLTMIKK